MTTTEIIGHPMSTWTRTARLALLHHGIEHTVRTPAFGQPEHAADHPFRKMPALRMGAVHLFESLAIVAWADSVGSGAALLPADGLQRAVTLQWYSAAVDHLYRPVVHTTEDADGIASAEAALDAVATGLRAGQLDRGHAADLAVLPMLAWHAREAPGRARLDARPALAAWLSRAEARPEMARTLA